MSSEARSTELWLCPGSCLVLSVAVCSFRGGSGGSSGSAIGVGTLSPRGPKGPRESSRASSRVVWAATRRIGVLGPLVAKDLVADEDDIAGTAAGVDFDCAIADTSMNSTHGTRRICSPERSLLNGEASEASN